MKNLIQTARAALVLTAALVVLCCGVYPLAVWGVAQWLMPQQANGSLVLGPEGQVRGSQLLGQTFTGAGYFHSRPSAAGYDAMNSCGSNLGPTSQKLSEQLQERIRLYRTVNQLDDTTSIPADAVAASASGLDPHISLKNAQLQLTRIARVRGLQLAQLRELLQQHTQFQRWTWLGEPSVHVLSLNMALDALTSHP